MSIYQIALLSLVCAAVFAVAALVIGWIRDARSQLRQDESEPDIEHTIRLIRAVTGHDPQWTADGYPIAPSVPLKRERR